MFGLDQEDKFSHNESTPGRKDRGKKDESSLLTILKQFKVFSPPDHQICLYNVATKDLVTDEIQVSLLNVKDPGHKQVKEFVEQRLQTVSQQQQDESSKMKFWDTKRRTRPQS